MRRIVLAFAVLAAVLPVRPAHADVPLWESLSLPAGVAEVRAALGIRSASPASDLILEVARKHFYLPGRHDARQPGFARLEQVLRAPAASAGRDSVPLPGGAALWLAASGKSGDALARALLLEPDAALFYTGLASLDARTLAFVASQPALARDLYRRRAPAFAAFGRAITVGNGRVEVPGGAGAEAVWATIAGVSPASPAAFISALMARGNGRLAYFYASVASLDEAHLRWVYGPAEDRAGRVAGLARIFEDVDPDWRVTAQPFRRPIFDPSFALRFARVTPDGGLAAPRPLDALAYLRGLFDTGGARAFDALSIARRAFDGSAAASRAGAAVGAVRQARPALGIALERMGVTDDALAARVGQAAATLDARVALREELTITWQAALSLASSAARHGARDDAALDALAGAVGAPDPFAAVLDWLVARSAGGASIEDGLIAWAAGRRPATAVTWEGSGLALDLAAWRRQAMRRALAHPRRLTLDDIVTLRKAQERVASREPLDAASLGALAPVMQRYDAAARVHAPLAEGAAAYRELLDRAGAGEIAPQARHLLSVRLLAAWRAAMVDALRVIVYAQTVNRPGTLPTSAADFARRHRFQPPERVSMAPAGPWELARVLASGELRLDGSLLELDLAVPEHVLRRPADEMPGEPVMLAGERAALARSVVLALDAAAAPALDAAASAIAAGRKMLAEASTAEAIVALAARAGMPAARANLLAWDAARDLAAARARFSLAEIAAVGGLPRVPAAWGSARLALDGCPCLGSPPPPLAWPDLAGRWDSGLLTAASADLALRVIELAAAFDLPGALVAPVLLVAANDVIERADPADPDDRDALARAVGAIDAARFEAYMLVLITEGMLVPEGGRP